MPPVASALARAGGSRPLAVGDRLNTDHVGARAAGIPGLHVLTGVSTARDVVLARPEERPAYLHTDLRGLLEPHPVPVRELDDEGSAWVVGTARCRVRAGTAVLDDGGALTEGKTEITLDAYRALACAVWEHLDQHGEDSAPAVPMCVCVCVCVCV